MAILNKHFKTSFGMCSVWRVLFEQHPPRRTHSLRLGSPDHNSAAKLVAENQKL
jgi:hypothetical protein